MSETACAALSASSTLLGGLFAALDRLLLAYAESTIRSGDIARCIV